MRTQRAIYHWNVTEQCGAENVLGTQSKVHGDCEYVAGKNVPICATVKRKAENIIGARGKESVNEMSEESSIGDDVNVYVVTSVTKVNKTASNELGNQVEESKYKDLGDCVKAKQMENTWNEMNKIDCKQISLEKRCMLLEYWFTKSGSK